MESRENVKGIAARIAVWSARHRALAILGWLVFVVGVTVLSGQAGMVEATGSDYGNGESGRADRVVEQAGFPQQGAGEMVIITSKHSTADSPQVRAATAEVTKAVQDTAATGSVAAVACTAAVISAIAATTSGLSAVECFEVTTTISPAP